MDMLLISICCNVDFDSDGAAEDGDLSSDAPAGRPVLQRVPADWPVGDQTRVLMPRRWASDMAERPSPNGRQGSNSTFFGRHPAGQKCAA